MSMRPTREQVIVEEEARQRHADFTGPRFEDPYEATAAIARYASQWDQVLQSFERRDAA